MKTCKYILIISILLLLPAYSYASDLGYMHISLIRGDVQIKTDDTLDWVAASVNMPLREGDRLWVPEGGRTEIRLRDGTCVRLDQNSGLEILTAGDSNQFYLSLGRAYVNFRGQNNALFQMDTPLSAVRAYDPSKFNIDVLDNGYTELSVMSGAVYAESRSGQTRVSAGKTLSIGENRYAELSPLGPSGEWESWNRDRDNSLYARGNSYERLPTELSPYSYDFDHYGRWVHTPSYGYVWTPTFSVSVGWSPYSVGRWVWVGGDYVWISYEPWGWVPYHYGRWTWVVSIGWCWLPPSRSSVYWGPGYVGWYYTPSYVSWVPLGPRDIYYGYGHYGPHSVNLGIHRHITKPIVYQNVLIHNAVMTVNRDVFLRGHYSRKALRENPFQRGVLNAGRPQITPVRATKTPLVKDIPLAKQPPQMVRKLNTKELKNNRPLVKGRDYSVLRPKTRAQEMTVKTVQKRPSLLTKGTAEQGARVQKQGSTQGKQNVLTGRTANSIPGKPDILQRPSSDSKTYTGGKSPSASTTQKPAELYGKPDNSRQVYRGDQPDAKATNSFNRYQPYSQQKRTDTPVAKQYTKPSEPVVKRQIQKTSDLNRPDSSPQGISKKEYTARGSSRTTLIRKEVSNAQVKEIRPSVSNRSVTPRPKESQKTYVPRENRGSQYTQYSRRDITGETTSRKQPSGSELRQQPQAGSSKAFSGTPWTGLSRPAPVGSSRSPAINFGR